MVILINRSQIRLNSLLEKKYITQEKFNFYNKSLEDFLIRRKNSGHWDDSERPKLIEVYKRQARKNTKISIILYIPYIIVYLLWFLFNNLLLFGFLLILEVFPLAFTSISMTKYLTFLTSYNIKKNKAIFAYIAIIIVFPIAIVLLLDPIFLYFRRSYLSIFGFFYFISLLCVFTMVIVEIPEGYEEAIMESKINVEFENEEKRFRKLI